MVKKEADSKPTRAEVETVGFFTRGGKVSDMGIDLEKYKPAGKGDYPPFLKSADIKKTLVVKILDVREANIGGNDRILLDVELGKDEKRTLSANKTNVGALTTLFGEDTDKWVGKKVSLMTIPVRNPTTGEMTKGIRIQV